MAKFKIDSLGGGLLNEHSKELATNDFQITFVPIEDIEPNPRNTRIDLREIEELKASISSVGLEQNIVVRTLENSRYMVLTGHRRFKALQELVAEGDTKYKMIPCLIKNLDKIDLPLSEEDKEDLAIITTNVEFNPLTDAELLESIKTLERIYDNLKKAKYKGLGAKRDYIAKRVGISESKVQILDYIDRNLDEFIKDEFLNENIPLTVANEIAHLEPKEQKKIAKSVDEVSELTVSDVQEFKEKTEKKAEKKEVKNVADELEHEFYTIDETNFEPIKSRFNSVFTGTLNKKEYAKLITAMNNIEKQFDNIDKLFENNKKRMQG